MAVAVAEGVVAVVDSVGMSVGSAPQATINIARAAVKASTDSNRATVDDGAEKGEVIWSIEASSQIPWKVVNTIIAPPAHARRDTPETAIHQKRRGEAPPQGFRLLVGDGPSVGNCKKSKVVEGVKPCGRMDSL